MSCGNYNRNGEQAADGRPNPLPWSRTAWVAQSPRPRSAEFLSGSNCNEITEGIYPLNQYFPDTHTPTDFPQPCFHRLHASIRRLCLGAIKCAANTNLACTENRHPTYLAFKPNTVVYCSLGRVSSARRACNKAYRWRLYCLRHDGQMVQGLFDE